MKRKFWNWVRDSDTGERTLVLNGTIAEESWFGDEVTPGIFRDELTKGEYQKRYNGLVERYEKAKARFDEVTEAIAERSAKSERLAGFIRTLETQREPVAEFDDRLWDAMVDYVTVGVDKWLTVMFRDGTSIET